MGADIQPFKLVRVDLFECEVFLFFFEMLFSSGSGNARIAMLGRLWPLCFTYFTLSRVLDALVLQHSHADWYQRFMGCVCVCLVCLSFRAAPFCSVCKENQKETTTPSVFANLAWSYKVIFPALEGRNKVFLRKEWGWESDDWFKRP